MSGRQLHPHRSQPQPYIRLVGNLQKVRPRHRIGRLPSASVARSFSFTLPPAVPRRDKLSDPPVATLDEILGSGGHLQFEWPNFFQAHLISYPQLGMYSSISLILNKFMWKNPWKSLWIIFSKV